MDKLHALMPVAVHLFFFKDNRVLLLRRFKTGWQDGNYSVPAGHVDAGETVTSASIREAREETGVDLQARDIEVVHVMHRKSEEERIDFFLIVRYWTGEITNREPHKCDDLRWFSLEALPVSLIPYVKQGLESYQKGILFSEHGWKEKANGIK
jgi:8-oxo-dGTP diphosphatase